MLVCRRAHKLSVANEKKGDEKREGKDTRVPSFYTLTPATTSSIPSLASPESLPVPKMLHVLIIACLLLLVQHSTAQTFSNTGGNLFTAPQYPQTSFSNVGNAQFQATGTSQFPLQTSFGTMGGTSGFMGAGGGFSYPGSAFSSSFGSLGPGQFAGMYNPAYLGLQGVGLGPALGGLSGIYSKNLLALEDEPMLLTCRNVQSLYTPYGPRISAVAVSIYEKQKKNIFDLKHGGLSLELAVKIDGLKGPAKIIFTQNSVVSKGCTAESLGDVFTGYNQKADVLQGMSLFGDLFHSGDDGVVTSLSLLPDRKSAVQVDNLGPAFKDLSMLAGRGVAIVESVKSDYFGRTAIDGKVYACCSLAYDNKPRDLIDEYHSPSAQSTYPAAPPSKPGYSPAQSSVPDYPPVQASQGSKPSVQAQPPYSSAQQAGNPSLPSYPAKHPTSY